MGEAFSKVESSLTGRRWVGLPNETLRQGLAISQALQIPEIVSRTIAAQGVTVEEAKTFLDSKIKYLLPDPKSFKDVEKAAKRLISAINQGHKIAIFSDYDVDGAASGALLNNWLRDLGVPCTIYIPDRIREGFGPNITAMEKLSKTHDLIICLDCGTVAFESILAANPTDVIIVDHHLAEENLPEAFAIINPSRQDETGNFKYLCATAMVFILLVEANTQLKNDNVNAPNLLKFLDLVALATIADVAPLIGLNRAFVKQGLLVIANRTNPGLSALSDVCQLTSKPSTYDLGFLLGPRINAGGRIGNSKLGVELLIAQTEIEAELIASKLNKLNVDRREIEKKVLHEASTQVNTRDTSAPLIWAAKEGWHPGVVGIIASRLKEQNNRPAVVIGLEDGIGSGSARSIKGIDIGSAITRLSSENLIIKGGGHSMAAGLSLREDQIPTAMQRLTNLLIDNGANDISPKDLIITGTLMCSAVTQELVAEFDNAGPFGAGAPAPRLALLNQRILFAKRAGENHLRLTVSDDSAVKIDVIVFRAFETSIGEVLENHNGLRFHLAGRLQIDDWGGRKRVKMNLEDAAYAK
jgi:single-stranded-DNA-specific exonuclease